MTFCFIETGAEFNGRRYHIRSKRVQSEMAYNANVNHIGRPMQFVLRNYFGHVIDPDKLNKPFYRENCLTCGSRLICNGCGDCGRCK